MDDELFNVVQFFPDGFHEYHSRNVPAKDAVEAMKRCTETVGARLGTTVRIIVTDGGDSIVAEWIYGKGLTYPTPEMRALPPSTQSVLLGSAINLCDSESQMELFIACLNLALSAGIMVGAKEVEVALRGPMVMGNA